VTLLIASLVFTAALFSSVKRPMSEGDTVLPVSERDTAVPEGGTMRLLLLLVPNSDADALLVGDPLSAARVDRARDPMVPPGSPWAW
jgi:hypothetical protein